MEGEVDSPEHVISLRLRQAADHIRAACGVRITVEDNVRMTIRLIDAVASSIREHRVDARADVIEIFSSFAAHSESLSFGYLRL